MRIIIKYYIGIKSWSTIFSTTEVFCEAGGFISNSVFEKMQSENILQEILQTEIIEKYYRHSSLLLDIRLCRYYEIVKPINK